MFLLHLRLEGVGASIGAGDRGRVGGARVGDGGDRAGGEGRKGVGGGARGGGGGGGGARHGGPLHLIMIGKRKRKRGWMQQLRIQQIGPLRSDKGILSPICTIFVFVLFSYGQ